MKEKRKYADRAEYIKKAVSKRRKKLKDMAIKYKGGKCQLCGYKRCEDALEFHHVSQSKKERLWSFKRWFDEKLGKSPKRN